MEQDHLHRVDERNAEICGQQLGIEVFAAACHVVALRYATQMRGDGFEVSGQIDLQLQLSDDVGKALPYLPQRGQKILACAGSVISPKYKTACSYGILQD